MAENFTQNLRIAMAARDVTQSGLAGALGVSRSFMSEVCAGRKMPKSSRLVDIAKLLNVSMDYLLGADDVQGQIEDLLAGRPVRVTMRQAYQGWRLERNAEADALRRTVARSGE